MQEITDMEIDVFRNDKISISSVEKYSHIILSPGPGLPMDAGIMCELIKKYGSTKKILGVCLGHQAIAEVYGAKLENMREVMHGVSSQIKILKDCSKNYLFETSPQPSPKGEGDTNEIFRTVTYIDEKLFSGLPTTIEVGHYHSWIVSENNFPDCLQITSVDSQNRIMSLRHKSHNVCGIQFHPESILTSYGKEMLSSFINKS